MVLDPYEILILLSAIVILSYLFDIFSRWSKIPSVIMLIGSGIGLRYLSNFLNVQIPFTQHFLELFGIIGLILIVLEGSLDLKLAKEKTTIIRKSLATAFFSLLGTAFLVALMFHKWLDVPFHNSLINAIPFAVISSAIAIPSVANLAKAKSEFIVYESTFSDILGIMFFNFLIASEVIGFNSFVNFAVGLFLILVISVISCFALVFFINRIKLHIKFFLIISLLIIVYALGKLFHLSSLLMILFFGLAINNARLFLDGRLGKYFVVETLDTELHQLKLITGESAFLIRTFFFVLFGFSFELQTLLDKDVILMGSLIILIVIAVRYVFLKFIVRSSIFPELFVAPRGLITILLFFSIPQQFLITGFSKGVLFFVIIISSLMMMFGLMGTKKEVIEKMEDY